MRRSTSCAASLALAVSAVAPAQAAFHLMKVVEVFPGSVAAPNAQYVVLQMHAAGQNLVQGHFIRVYDATGAPIGTFTFNAAVPVGTNQSKILIATTEAATFFAVGANLAMQPILPAAGGKVCFDAVPEDCVAWGNYSGSAVGVGTPFNAAGGLVSGSAAIRRLNGFGSPTVLEAGDDTDNCANDFVLGMPAPRNNAGQQGVVPPSTCGNNVIESLEQCDDGNTSNGDGCSATCTNEPPLPALIFASGFENPLP